MPVSVGSWMLPIIGDRDGASELEARMRLVMLVVNWCVTAMPQLMICSDP